MLIPNRKEGWMRKLLLAGALAVLAAPAARAADSAIVLIGRGDQVYACTAAGADYKWRLKAPDATLADAAGRVVGKHFAGPTWQADDGSSVVGEALVASPSPQQGAVPWLILRAKSHGGSGVFSNIGYVVRSATEGGPAPETGCDAGHAGAEIRVHYSATYTFFPG